MERCRTSDNLGQGCATHTLTIFACGHRVYGCLVVWCVLAETEQIARPPPSLTLNPPLNSCRLQRITLRCFVLFTRNALVVLSH